MGVTVNGRRAERRGGHGGARREPGRKVVALRHVDHRRAALEAHYAVVRVLGARKHAQERRLARAVRADEAHAVALGDRQPHAAEEFAPAVGFREVGGDEEHGGDARSAGW